MINHPNRSKQTAFQQFWAAINLGLKARGVPEMTFSPARHLWAEAIHEAEADFYRAQVAKIAKCGMSSK